MLGHELTRQAGEELAATQLNSCQRDKRRLADWSLLLVAGDVAATAQVTGASSPSHRHCQRHPAAFADSLIAMQRLRQQSLLKLSVHKTVMSSGLG